MRLSGFVDYRPLNNQECTAPRPPIRTFTPLARERLHSECRQVFSVADHPVFPRPECYETRQFDRIRLSSVSRTSPEAARGWKLTATITAL